MEAENKIDYNAVRDDLIARRDELNSAIAAIERVLAIGGATITATVKTSSHAEQHSSGLPTSIPKR